MSRRSTNPGGQKIIFSGNNTGGFVQGVNNGNTNVYIPHPIAGPFSNVPHPPNRCYIDRKDIYSEMEHRLLMCGARVALVGLGGVGKSELAIEYAHRTRENQPGTYVFWVHASNKAAFESSLVKIARDLKLDHLEPASTEDILRRVYGWLGNDQNGPWVLIMDSADKMKILELILAPENYSSYGSAFFPQSTKGKILVTSRSKDFVERIVARSDILEVGVMSEKEALSLLQKKINVGEDEHEAAELVADLGYIPLAIDQAASYIEQRQPRYGVKEYRERLGYDTCAVDLLSRDCGNISRDCNQPRSVLEAWKMSMDYIAKKRSSAAILLQYMSCFNYRGIPDFVLYESRFQDERKSRKSRVVATKSNQFRLSISTSGKSSAQLKMNARQPTHRRPHKTTSDHGAKLRRVGVNSKDTAHPMNSWRTEWDEFHDDILILRNFSLISTNGDGSMFHMHPLVQLATKAWMKDLGLTDERYGQYLMAMAEQFPTNVTRLEDRKICENLLPHIDFDSNRPSLTGSVKYWIKLFTSLTHYQVNVGQASNALRTAWKAYQAEQWFEKKTKANTNKGAAAALASVFFDIGNFQESEELFREIMERRLEKYGENHLQTLSSMAGLASALERLHRYHEAKSLYDRFFRIAQDKLNANDELSTTTRQNRDMLLRKIRRQSVSLYETSLWETIRKHGEISLPAFQGGIRLGRVLREGGDIDKAKRVLERVLGNAANSLDDRDYSITPACKYELGITYHQLGRYEISEIMLQQALMIYEKHQGKESFNARITRNELREVFRSQGK